MRGLNCAIILSIIVSLQTLLRFEVKHVVD